MSARLPVYHVRSKGEEEFDLHCRLEKLRPLREYVFHPTRKWRIDFAWPENKLAVEIESSVHRIKSRFSGDIEKYNALTMGGWSILRFTAQHVHSGEAINCVLLWLAERPSGGSSGKGAGL